MVGKHLIRTILFGLISYLIAWGIILWLNYIRPYPLHLRYMDFYGVGIIMLGYFGLTLLSLLTLIPKIRASNLLRKIILFIPIIGLIWIDYMAFSSLNPARLYVPILFIGICFILTTISAIFNFIILERKLASPNYQDGEIIDN